MVVTARRRLAGLSELLVALVTCASCGSSPRDCTSIHGLDNGAGSGRASPQKALAFLEQHPPHWLDRSGWQVSEKSEDFVVFTTHTDRVEVARSAGEWWVDSFISCR